MGIIDQRKYTPDCSPSSLPADAYFNKTEKFGHFTEDGATYVIERRDTPRPWLHYLCNDKIYSCIDNVGGGFIFHSAGYRVTKQWERPGYSVHDPCGKRVLLIDGQNFFDTAENFMEYVTPGSVKFVGDLGELHITLTMLVPKSLPCECWNICIENRGEPRDVSVLAQQDWYFKTVKKAPCKTWEDARGVRISKNEMYAVFAMTSQQEWGSEHYTAENRRGEPQELTRVWLSRSVSVADKETINVVSGASLSEQEVEDTLCCLSAEEFAAQMAQMQQHLEHLLGRNQCRLPDKNTERMLNFWLKNQVRLDYYYDRGNLKGLVGYRDGLQDSWGCMMLDPELAKEKLICTLAHMLKDGRCPRQYHRLNDSLHDMRDFADSIIWVADAIASYVKETGNAAIMDQMIPFLDSEELTTVEDHILRGLDSLYTLRGKDGLIRMRGGDWLDGLEGINKYGEDATSAWLTVAAFHAQNVMAELFDYMGKADTAALMRERAAEYKAVVNQVAWDGNWYCYAFFEDGEPIGSSRNLEGKIHSNVQTWAIFSGITDDPDKVRRIEKAMNRYLQTPFGPMLLYPPYVFHGERCGRLQRQRPGTFANGAVYNHAAGFKVFADVARGDYDDALDTLQRAMPGHPDNSDMCRIGEPYAVGNVYFGEHHPRFGMNLYTWWTATTDWLLHGGFEQILGVKAGYKGLEITPHVPIDWQSYEVHKQYRGTLYHIYLERSEEKGIWLDGVKQDTACINSDQKECTVTVKF